MPDDPYLLRFIASYPKSGNTWVRILLWNFCRDNGPSHPNEIAKASFGTIDDAEWLYQEAFGLAPETVTHEQSLKLRPYAHMYLRNKAWFWGAAPLIKTHTCNGFLAPSQAHPFVNWHETHSAVVLVRNPLDVCPSWAHHMGVSVDECADRMGAANFTISRNDGRHVTMIDSWSRWVGGWLQQAYADKVLCVKYEEIEERLAEIIHHLDFSDWEDDARVARAIENSRLSVLKESEEQDGFAEASPQAGKKGFFGGEREPLTDYAREKIIADHGEIMEMLGYSHNPAGAAV